MITVKKTIAAMVISMVLAFGAQSQCVVGGAVFDGDFRSVAPFLEGSYRVEILANGEATITVSVANPCSEVQTDEGVTIGNSNVNIYGDYATFEAECDANGNLVGTLSLQGFCSLQYGPGGSQPTTSPINVTAPPVQGTNPNPTPVGPTPTPGPGGSGGMSQVDVRSSLGTTNPVAQLVGIEVEINPPVLEIASAVTNTKSTQGETDVTITGRLLFSNDNLPAGFKMKEEGWQFFPQRTEDKVSYKEDWKSAMLNDAYLDFLDWRIPGDDDWKKYEKVALSGLFRIDPDTLPKAIRSKEIPIRASYTDENGVEYSQIVNLRIAKKNKNRPGATSSGPSARVVTYSRILE